MSPGSRTFPSHSPRFAWAAGLVFLLILLTLGLRILSPSDIVSRDQSRTVSYTIDIVRNGNLLLASDADGFLATKPPLVNYFSALLVAPFGPNEWTFMFPSLLAFFATLALIYLIARDVFVEMPPHPGWLGLTAAEWATLLAVAFYGLSAMALRLAFVARPDMILVFFLTLSFYAANRALASQPSQGAGWAFVFWFAACLAALAKGPIALIPVAYAFLAAKVFHGGWDAASRLSALYRRADCAGRRAGLAGRCLHARARSFPQHPGEPGARRTIRRALVFRHHHRVAGTALGDLALPAMVVIVARRGLVFPVAAMAQTSACADPARHRLAGDSVYPGG